MVFRSIQVVARSAKWYVHGECCLGTCKLKYSISRADLGGGGVCAWGAEAPPPKFYHVQARKLLEVLAIASYTYAWAMKRWKEKGEWLIFT